MRHKNSGRKLGRTSSHRKALFKNMATALLTYGRITTTEAKAKEIRGVVEPLITLAQQDNLHARREAYRVLNNHKLVKRLFDEIAPLFKDMRKGGYTRVVKLALPRKGDAAPMAVVELLRGPQYQEDGKSAPKKAAKAAPAAPAATEGDAAADNASAEATSGKKAAKPKAAPKSETKNSKVAGPRPKSTPRKIGG